MSIFEHDDEWELVGRVPVDSGQVMITDPCYLGEFENDNYSADDDNTEVKFSYSGACHRTLADGAGQVTPLAVASSTGYGDGMYPVYAMYDNSGMIMQLAVDFSHPAFPSGKDAGNQLRQIRFAQAVRHERKMRMRNERE